MTAKNLQYLLNIGVTHVLNTAETDVNINPQRYTKEGICYKGFRVSDVPHANIEQFFDESVEFIDRALSFSMGKVFVACLLVKNLFFGLGDIFRSGSLDIPINFLVAEVQSHTL